MGIKTIYLEFDIKEKKYKEYEHILEQFIQDIQICLANGNISIDEIDQGEMGIQM